MCTGKCSKVVAISLYVLALVSVICNIILFFPDFESQYVSDDGKNGEPRITPEVKYMGGLIGGGVMILIPAIHIHLTSTKGCCNNRCGMFLSIGFAALGVVGALYSGATNLGDKDVWEWCHEPENVVEFNLGLFCTLLIAACLQGVLCAIQMVNGLFGCICGTLHCCFHLD